MLPCFKLSGGPTFQSKSKQTKIQASHIYTHWIVPTEWCCWLLARKTGMLRGLMSDILLPVRWMRSLGIEETVQPVSGIESIWKGLPFGPWTITVKSFNSVTGKSGASALGFFLATCLNHSRILVQQFFFGLGLGIGKITFGGLKMLEFSPDMANWNLTVSDISQIWAFQIKNTFLAKNMATC